jgi:hypothetical protein
MVAVGIAYLMISRTDVSIYAAQRLSPADTANSRPVRPTA